jgi:hypothetical protein
VCASSCFGAMSDETDVRPGVGGAVRYGYVILTTYHTYLDLSSITDTGYFGYYSITHTIVCVILAKKQYHISIHGYYNVHGTPGQMVRMVRMVRMVGVAAGVLRRSLRCRWRVLRKTLTAF